MAYSPEVKARAVAEIAKGETYESVATKYGVTRRSVQLWVNEARSIRKVSSGDIQDARKARFSTALDEFLFSTIKMVHAWAEECADRKFIKDNPSGVNELGKTVLERADRMVSVLEGNKPEKD